MKQKGNIFAKLRGEIAERTVLGQTNIVFRLYGFGFEYLAKLNCK
jgi:hypothetical protein